MYRNSFTAVMFVFLALNYLNYHRFVPGCDDCPIRNGFPFPVLVEGGYSPTHIFVWWGFLGNIAVILAATILLAKAWHLVRSLSR
jgi:hypothetical protein